MSSKEFDSYEDSYGGAEFDSFSELLDCFHELAEDALFAQWNVPVWIDYEDANGDDARMVRIGVMGTRHGVCWQWAAPAAEAQVTELRRRMLTIWAARADTGFARHASYNSALGVTSR